MATATCDTRIIFSAAGTVEVLRDGTAPACPDDAVVIRNRCTVVSAGTELACLAGREWWFSYGSVPGYCAAGEITAIGRSVTGWMVGDRVVHYGGHRLWQTRIPGRDFLHRLPDGAAWEHAAFAHLATISITALRQSDIGLGDDVLVTGLGVVGNLAAQCAALQGAQVVGIDPEPARVALARACGIDAIVGTAAGQADALRARTGGRGFSSLIEASGRAQTLAEVLPLAARNGEVLLLGTPRAPYQTDLAAVLRPFHLFEQALTLRSAQEWLRPVEATPFVKHSMARDTRIVIDLMTAGRLRVDPLITHRIGPAQAPAIYRELAGGAPGIGAVVIAWGDEA